jgi:ribosomal protein L34
LPKKIKIIEQYKPDANKPSRISGFRLRGNRQAIEKEREIISVGLTL